MAGFRRISTLIAGALIVAACGGGGAASPAATTAAGATPVPAASAPAATPTTAPVTPAPTAGPTACDHPYYPLRTGATWTTNNGPGVTIPAEVTGVTGDSAKAVAKLKTTNPGGSTFTTDILCGADGLAYGDALYVGADGKQGTRKLTAGTGVFLPAAAKLADGLTFSWTMTGDFDFPSYDSAGKFVAQIKYTVTLSEDCTVSGPKTVTLSTGDQSGFQITCTGTHKSTDANGKVFETPNPINLYYLKGIGPSGVDPGTELVSYSIP